MKGFFKAYTMFLAERGSKLLLILKYLLLILIGFLLFVFLHDNQLTFEKYEVLLPTILSTTGIAVAVIISFLFSKLYSEKNERIERKRLIDIESNKITALRKVCHFLRKSHEFWKPFGNLKHKLDNDYKHLTLDYYNDPELDYTSYSAFINEVPYGELGGQAYVGLKEIEGNEYSDFVFYDSQLRKNYSLNELGTIHQASGLMWTLFDKFNRDMVELNTISILDLKQIKKNYAIIYPNSKELNNKKLQEMFSDFQSSITRRLFYLTERNNRGLGRYFKQILINLLVFSIVIILGIFIMSIEFTFCSKTFDTLALITIFIINMIDLIINIVFAINKELKIKEFYEI